MKYYDQHIHSSFSKDSEEDLENYFIKAKENGIEYVITCEHFDPHTSVDGTSWDADYDALIAYQKKLKKKLSGGHKTVRTKAGGKKSFHKLSGRRKNAGGQLDLNRIGKLAIVAVVVVGVILGGVLGVRKLLELKDIRNSSTTELINGLVIITHHAEIAPFACEQTT